MFCLLCCFRRNAILCFESSPAPLCPKSEQVNARIRWLASDAARANERTFGPPNFDSICRRRTARGRTQLSALGIWDEDYPSMTRGSACTSLSKGTEWAHFANRIMCLNACAMQASIYTRKCALMYVCQCSAISDFIG